MKKVRKSLLVFTFVMAVCMTAFTSVTVSADQKEKRIAEGVYIGSVYVGGMTEAEADEAVSNYVRRAKNAVLTLESGAGSAEVKVSELGVYFQDGNVVQEAMDVGRNGSLIKRFKDKKELRNGTKTIRMDVNIDPSAVKGLLKERSEELNQEAEDGGLVRKNGQFEFIEGTQGIKVNIEDSTEAVVSYMQSGWDGTDTTVSLVEAVAEPRGSREELEKIQDLLGSYNTNYSSSTQNRCDNISLAASKINGTVLYPGEEFSVNATVGPLIGSNGYKLAGAYENGQTVQAYGGGACQVSTTLYNAVILSELEVTERSNHSMTVNYVKASMDAAIAGDYLDLKFVNNYDTPIYIEGYTQGKNLYFNIYGEETRPSNRKVSFESEIVSKQDPGTQFVATGDPAGYIGVSQGKRIGYVARLWKIVTVNGVEESREVFNKSTYRSVPKIVKVGTASEDPNVSAIIGAALATGDEATIYGTAASYTANANAELNPLPPAENPTPEEQAIIGTPEGQ